MEHLLIPYEAEKQIKSGTALILAPHPDDEVFGCGGAIIRHVAAGDPVHVVIATDGGQQPGGDENPDYAEVRKQESVAAAQVLGYEAPAFLGFPDRSLEYGEKLILQLLEEVGKYKPDLIYAPSIFEIHPDHRALGMCVLEAVRRAKKPVKLLLYEIGSPLHPNLLLDISDISEQKQEAMACFKSQLAVQDYSEHIQALNRFRTYTLPKTVTAAEAYMVADSAELADDPFGIYSSEFTRQAKSALKLDPGNALLVTVIIRSIGRESYLREALDSVALQTYPNIEVLLVNAKGEGHPEMGEWCGRFPMRVCGTGEPLARSRAANFGLDNAKGEYLIFLDDDDLFDPVHIANLMSEAKKNDAKIVYSGVRCVDSQSGEVIHYNSPYDYNRLITGNFIPIHAVLFSRVVVEHDTRFDESLDLFEDWDFWLQLSVKEKFVHFDAISAEYRVLQHLGSRCRDDTSTTRNAKLKVYKKWLFLWPDDCLISLFSSANDKYYLLSIIDKLSFRISSEEEDLKRLEIFISNKDRHIKGLENFIYDKDRHIKGLESALSEGDHVEDLQMWIADKDRYIGGLEALLSDRYRHIQGLKTGITDKDRHIKGLEAAIVDKDRHIKGLEAGITDKDRYIKDLEILVSGIQKNIFSRLFSKKYIPLKMIE